MSLTPEALYLQLGHLVQEMPEMRAPKIIGEDVYRWLGRAAALVEATGHMADSVQLSVSENLSGALQDLNAQTIATIVHRALARAEMNAPAVAKGAFIAAGSAFDAFAAVGKVLSTVKSDVLLVDPYADEKVLTEYALLAPEKITLRLLTGDTTHKATLKPAAERWLRQHSQQRPLEVRLAPARSLHDRLILVDNATAWTLGQSFNALAERAHTSISRMEPEPGSRKIDAHALIWQAAQPI